MDRKAGHFILHQGFLPNSGVVSARKNELRDLPFRMLTGGILTLAVTGIAAIIGEVWSGILAVFPVIGIVLAVFTHKTQGSDQVAHVYHRIVRGLYSFAGFFLALAILWPRIEFWSACVIALLFAAVIQIVIQWRVSLNKLM